MGRPRWILAAAMAGGAVWGAGLPGSAEAGRRVFEAQQCIQCHSVNGQGGKRAPDLGKPVGRDYTPTAMTALMWNHAPAMWQAIAKAGGPRPTVSEQAAADLFAYFAAERFFDRPGDAARGKRDFRSLHCAECHGIAESKADGAPPVAKWESLTDPIALAAQMWNHGARMREEFARKGIRRLELSGQQLTDLLVYLQNLPETRSLAAAPRAATPAGGEELFRSKGCAGCHTGSMALETRLRGQTLTDIAADLWDHQPLMKPEPRALTEGEMRQILGYLWARQYLAGEGNAARGHGVFAAKRCAECHHTVPHRDYSDVTMVSVLWEHGPHMLDAMRQKGIPWPRFTTRQMADLIAWLNTK